MFRQVICDTCGNVEVRPSNAPADTPPEMGRTQLREYLRGDEWGMGGRPFTAREQQLMQSIAGRCGCGGVFHDEDHPLARVRCPECLSLSVHLVDTGLMLD